MEADMQALIGKTIVKIKVIENDNVVILFHTSDNDIFRLPFGVHSEDPDYPDIYYKIYATFNGLYKLSADDFKKMEKEKWYIEAIERKLIDTYE